MKGFLRRCLQRPYVEHWMSLSIPAGQTKKCIYTQISLLWYQSSLDQYRTWHLAHLEENSAVKCSKASASFSLLSGTVRGSKVILKPSFEWASLVFNTTPWATTDPFNLTLWSCSAERTHGWFPTGWGAHSKHLWIVHTELWRILEIIPLAVTDHMDICTLQKQVTHYPSDPFSTKETNKSILLQVFLF